MKVLWQIHLGYIGYIPITIATLFSLVSPLILDYLFIRNTPDLRPISEEEDHSTHVNYGLMFDVVEISFSYAFSLYLLWAYFGFFMTFFFPNLTNGMVITRSIVICWAYFLLNSPE